jgi:hypothetical protein
LVTIASKNDFGTRCSTKSRKDSDEACTPALAPASGSGSPSEAPGCSAVTITMPSSSDSSEAPMNQAMVRRPIRPSAPPDAPMCATPATRVENTSGPMIILISRRKTSVASEK